MMQGPQSKTSQQLKNEREVRKYLDELGNSEAVARLIDRYGKVSTRRVYLVSLVLYFRWLKSARAGATLTGRALAQTAVTLDANTVTAP